MTINFIIQKDRFQLKDRTKLKKWISLVIQQSNMRVGEIGYLFCDDNYLLEINQSYLNHDTYTDIITFDYVAGDVVSGDILISVDRVRENASLFDTSFRHELLRVIIHGILHLLGNGDKTESEAVQMRRLEDQAIALWNTVQ